VFNLTPIAVVAGARFASWWIATDDLAFLVTGIFTVGLSHAGLTISS
jgi:hypothetical protein